MGSEVYEAQVALLVRVLSRLDTSLPFALKGGTAINLFVHALPRLSVDIDLAYTGSGEREDALEGIHAGLQALRSDLETMGLRVNPSPPGAGRWTKLAVSDGRSQVKVEVNPVLRGTVHAPVRRRVHPVVEDRFGFAEVAVLALPDLYGGKLVAALDRQHPRDLFDVHLFLEENLLDRPTVEAFLVYLISHGRPVHEVLAPRLKDISREYEAAFVGMTTVPISLGALTAAREQLLTHLHAALTQADRQFLLSVAQGVPDWGLLGRDGIEVMPAVRWKLQNIAHMSDAKRQAAVAALTAVLWPRADVERDGGLISQ